MDNIHDRILLNCGTEMPALGLGMYKITKEKDIINTLTTALDAGYRMIDTASVYKNEDSIGKAMKTLQIPRDELFITTKVWNTAQRLGDIAGPFERSLQRLQLDYVDLYLIHWPVPGCYRSTWKEMEKIYLSGKAKAIGVSNFQSHHLEDLISAAEVIPAVNQFEYHPLLHQKELAAYCTSKGIHSQAYSPLAQGLYLNREVMVLIGSKYGKTAAQVGLKWAIQRGLSVIPKSINPQRIRENADIFDFSLSKEDLTLIDALNENYRTGGDPDNINM